MMFKNRERDVLSFLIEEEFSQAVIRKGTGVVNHGYSFGDDSEYFICKRSKDLELRIDRFDETICYKGIMSVIIPDEKYAYVLDIINAYNYFNPVKCCVIGNLGVTVKCLQSCGVMFPKRVEIQKYLHILVKGIDVIIRNIYQFLMLDFSLKEFAKNISFDLKL